MLLCYQKDIMSVVLRKCFKVIFKMTYCTGAQPPRSVTSLCSVIVWKAPTRTYGVITGYEVSFSLSGRDNGVVVSKNRDELFHIVRASELPRGEGDILVMVSIFYVLWITQN